MTLEPYTPGGLDRRTDSWTLVVEQVAILATRIADTELVPATLRGKPAAVAAVILYGREIGLPPMTALRTSYVVNGRVALAAETLRALVLAAGHDFRYEEATTARCIAAGRRKGSEDWQTVEWTQDLARKAGLGGPSWQKYPRQMLKARATAELCRDLFPDVIGGFEAVEELDDGTVTPAPDTTPRRTVRRTQTPAGGEPPSAHSPGNPADAAASVTRPDPPAGPELTAARQAAHAAGAIWRDQPPLPGEEEAEEATAPESNPPETPGPDATRDTGDWAISAPQLKKLHATLTDLGITNRELGLALLTRITERPVDSSKDLTRRESALVIDTLTRISAVPEMAEELRRIEATPNPAAELAGLFGEPPAPEEPPRPVDDIDTGELT